MKRLGINMHPDENDIDDSNMMENEHGGGLAVMIHNVINELDKIDDAMLNRTEKLIYSHPVILNLKSAPTTKRVIN